MNKNYLGLLFATIILLSMGASAVYAAIGVGSWVDNNNVVLNINAGQTAEFRYGVTAVSSYNGVVGTYSIMLYREGTATPLVTYVNNQATVGNGAIGRFNVTPANYGNTVGNYYVLINSADKFSSDSFRLNLNVGTSTNNGTLNVICAAVPSNGYAPLSVAFTALVSGTTQPYTYQWTYGDGQSSAVQSANQNSVTDTHLYNIIGTFNPTIRVVDSNNNIVTASCSVNGISVLTPILDIQNINCFPRVTDGYNQSCSVFVKSSNGLVPGNVDVNIYYTNGTLFGSCKTDALSGACEVETIVNGIGNKTIYATANASGYISDNDTQPRFTFETYTQRYNIINLGTYADNNFANPSSTFYRGQPLYLKFQVYDPVSNAFVTSDIVTAATLVSLPGGRADLSRMVYNGSWYYYSLDAIPLTHDFMGGSNVFAFAFNFTGLTSGQAQVSLTILNNKPTANTIPDVFVRVGNTYSLLLNNYGTDSEDKTLIWNVLTAPTLFTIGMGSNNTLLITGQTVGVESIKLRGYDLDGDFAETNVTVHVIPANATTNLAASCTPSQPNGTIPGPTNGTIPLTIVFNSQANGGTGPYTYEWVFGDGQSATVPSSASTSILYTNIYNAAGAYDPTLKVSDSVGNVVNANCGHIIVNSIVPPNNNLGVACVVLPNVGVAPLNVAVTSIITNGTRPYTIGFNFGNGASTNVLSILPTITQNTIYSLSGTYYPSITVTDGNGNTGNANCSFIIVSGSNSTNITFPMANTGGPYNGYINEPVTFNASMSVGNIVNYRWDFGDGTAIVDTASPIIQHTYSKVNKYTVKLILFDVNGYVVNAATTATIIERTTPKSVAVRNLPDKGIIVESLNLYGESGDVLSPNDELTAQMTIKNDWDSKLKNVRVTLSIPELGLESRAALFDLSRGSESSQTIILPLYDVAPGTYYAKISIDNDDGPDQVRRIKYREIVVKK